MLDDDKINSVFNIAGKNKNTHISEKIFYPKKTKIINVFKCLNDNVNNFP